MKKYHHGDLKCEIIRCGLKLLEAHGASGLSLRRCAEMAGVSHTAPKNHFGSLAGLIAELAAHGHAQLHAQLSAELDAISDRVARRANCMETYVNFALSNPGLYEVMFDPRTLSVENPKLRKNLQRNLELLDEVGLQSGQAEGAGTSSQRRFELALWSLLHGYVQLNINGFLTREHLSPRQALEVLVEDRMAG